MVRVTDSLLPQIAADFGTTVGEASIVVAAYAVSHGTIQLIIGPVGDRFAFQVGAALRRHRPQAAHESVALAAPRVAVQRLPEAREQRGSSAMKRDRPKAIETAD